MYPPAGNPYQSPHDPHGYPVYPPAQGNPVYPPPMPAPPWAPPGTEPQATPTTPNRRGVILAGVFGAVTMIGIMLGLFAIGGDSGQYFSNGTEVSPSADEHIVFVKEKDLAGQSPSTVHCTAATASGQQLTLSQPAEPATVTRSRRPTITYKSVADLPTDKGPLTVTCSGAEISRLLLAKPATSTGVMLFIGGYVAFMAILIVVVIIMRRRYFRRYPRIETQSQWGS